MSPKGALGWLVLVAGGYALWKLYQGSNYVSDVAQHVGEAIGGTAYTLINGDANAQVQSQFQQVMAALKAAGSPQVGTPQYNGILAQFGLPPAPAPGS